MGGACSKIRGEDERVEVVSWKARREEATKKTKT
jgi:hypothetical protein